MNDKTDVEEIQSNEVLASPRLQDEVGPKEPLIAKKFNSLIFNKPLKTNAKKALKKKIKMLYHEIHTEVHLKARTNK